MLASGWQSVQIPFPHETAHVTVGPQVPSSWHRRLLFDVRHVAVKGSHTRHAPFAQPNLQLTPTPQMPSPRQMRTSASLFTHSPAPGWQGGTQAPFAHPLTHTSGGFQRKPLAGHFCTEVVELHIESPDTHSRQTFWEHP
jgi:hypothetical protein